MERFRQIVSFPYAGHWLIDLAGDDPYGGSTPLVVGRAQPRGSPPVPLVQRTAGAPMDVSVTPFGVLVASERAAAVLRARAAADVQLLPAAIAGRAEPYVVANVTTVLDVLDRSPAGRRRVPGPGGGALSAPGYRLAGDHVAGAHLFRVENQVETIFVSESLATAFADAGLVGPGLLDPDTGEAVRPGARG